MYVLFELKENIVNKTKLETLISLKNLHQLCLGTRFENEVLKKSKDYYISSKFQREALLALVELENMVSCKIKTESWLSLHLVMSILFSTVCSQTNRGQLSDDEYGKIVIRNVLHLIGEENETIVNLLGQEFIKLKVMFEV